MFSPAFLEAHRDWTVSRWVLPLLDQPAIEIADMSIMTFGLSGEVAEVADIVEQWAISGICDTSNLVKELGDVIFYWSRLSARFNLPYVALLTESDVSDRCKGCPAARPPVLEVLRMVRAAGLASEAIKKYLRDGALSTDKLARGMQDLYQAWLTVCIAAGLEPADVIDSNRDKVEGRVVRGTQRGSGDDR